MGTNLLLEGDDLEALLIRAHAEGGVNARIVRAEKVRQGGFLGFFARELFEVAVEIPDGADAPPAELAAPGAVASAVRTGTPAAVAPRAGRSPAELALDARLAAEPASPVAGDHARPHQLAPDDDRHGSAPGPQVPPTPGLRLSADEEEILVAELTRALAERPPAPAQLAVDGLIGLVDRVGAAERAAAQAASRSLVGVGATTATGSGTGIGGGGVFSGDSPRLVLPDGRIVAGTPAVLGNPGILTTTGSAAGSGGAASGRSHELPVISQRRTPTTTADPAAPAATPSAAPTGTGTGSAAGGTTTTAASAPGARRPAAGPHRPAGPGTPAGPLPPRAGNGPAQPDDQGGPGTAVPPWAVPHEPPASPMRPSTTRPEFTALLDQLRAGTVPRPRAAADLMLGRAGGPDVHGAEATGLARAQRAYEVPGSADVHAGPGIPADHGYPADHGLGRLAGPAVPPDAYRPALAPQARATLAERDRMPERDRAGEQAAAHHAAEQRLAGDRRTLRGLGVPSAWTRRMRAGDRFAAVLRMLERMPDVDIDPDVEVVALVGPRGVVQLEAHRTALDLPLEDRPRPVVVVPRDGRGRGPAIAKANKLGTVVVAIETDDYTCDGTVLENLQALGAAAVIAVVDADRPIEESQRWLDALGQVDAIAVDNTTAVGDPASVLQLGLPVVRLDGIPVDRVTWSALLCAQLEAADPAR